MTATDIKRAGLKVTLPRLKVLEVLENANPHHLSAEDVYKALLDTDDSVGLATVYRVFFGMRFTADGLKLDPFVPSAYSGTRTLEGFSYRDATLDLTVKGHGARITQITLDGEALDDPIVQRPPSLSRRMASSAGRAARLRQPIAFSGMGVSSIRPFRRADRSRPTPPWRSIRFKR